MFLHVYPGVRREEIPDLPYDLWQGMRRFAYRVLGGDA
jgi:hypothetical protein